MRCIDPLTREQLLEAIHRRVHCLPPDLCERLDEQPTGWLRLLLMSARLIYALRELRRQEELERALDARADSAP
jgi:hypothetical protein